MVVIFAYHPYPRPPASRMTSPYPSLIGLHDGFLRSSKRFPEHPALEVQGQCWTYEELRVEASRLAGTLAALPVLTGSLTGILAYRSPTAYAAALGILMSGRGVVPLNPTFPRDRCLAMMEQAQLKVLVLDDRGRQQLDSILERFKSPGVFVLPDSADVSDLSRAWPHHRFLGKADMAAPDDWKPQLTNPENVAYLLFTSGSTGHPKAVPLLHRNLTQFIRKGLHRYQFNQKDRFAQFYDFTWDAHLFELFGCWEYGACLCVPEPSQVLNPDHFIRDKQLTVVDTVPSTGFVMARMGSFKPGRFPSLRLLRLGGEAVPVEQAAAWALAAPQAVIENTYGPTEATVEVTSYVWDPTRSPHEAEQGIMPIGFPYPGIELRVVDERMEEVPEGAEGELLIAGEQVVPGYWNDPERSAASFAVPPGQNKVYYRTGDRVRRPASGQPLCFLGRHDDQIKIYGVRIELGEVEAALRDAAETPWAVALGWPKVPSGAGGIIAFVAQTPVEAPAILQKLKARLPNVMVPREIRVMDRLPVNANGKTDRKLLLSMLESNR